MTEILVMGSFDNLRSPQVRFLDAAAQLGDVHLLLLGDEAARAVDGKPPVFPQEERRYLLEALRFVSRVTLAPELPADGSLPRLSGLAPRAWAVPQGEDTPRRRAYCREAGIQLAVITGEQVQGFPARRFDALQDPTGRRKVVVTGCYDWLHSGHVRFFEEVSQLGDLYVIVGNDANVRLLKGEGHPLFSQDERRYMVQAVRFVHAALITSGMGWMDAEPEIEQLKPDIYAVNEDGDKPEKRAFCARHGLEYVVLKRVPRPGLPRRESTHLRGF